MMSEPEAIRLSKSEARDEVMRKLPDLSMRGFDRAWQRACEDTKSGWNKPGRPRGATPGAENQHTKLPRNRRGT